ncbi:MAG: hypothetical protein M3220_13450, partial [Chloroflexota bacterium]|nr:hypothetical protein [Chloroflexota bacterium]
IQADGLPPVLLDIEQRESTPLGDKLLLNDDYYSWAPDSSQLAVTMGGYRSAQDNKWLNLVDLPSGAVTTVITETEQVPGVVTWSPTGELIAYAAVPAEARSGEDNCCPITFANPAIAGRRIYLLDPASGASWRLNDADTFQDAPLWSEDGSILYYVQRAGDKMVLMAADPLTGQAAPVEGVEQPIPEVVGFYGQADWNALLAQIPRSSSPSSAPDTPSPAASSPAIGSYPPPVPTAEGTLLHLSDGCPNPAGLEQADHLQRGIVVVLVHMITLTLPDPLAAQLEQVAATRQTSAESLAETVLRPRSGRPLSAGRRAILTHPHPDSPGSARGRRDLHCSHT